MPNLVQVPTIELSMVEMIDITTIISNFDEGCVGVEDTTDFIIKLVEGIALNAFKIGKKEGHNHA